MRHDDGTAEVTPLVVFGGTGVTNPVLGAFCDSSNRCVTSCTSRRRAAARSTRGDQCRAPRLRPRPRRLERIRWAAPRGRRRQDRPRHARLRQPARRAGAPSRRAAADRPGGRRPAVPGRPGPDPTSKRSREPPAGRRRAARRRIRPGAPDARAARRRSPARWLARGDRAVRRRPALLEQPRGNGAWLSAARSSARGSLRSCAATARSSRSSRCSGSSRRSRRPSSPNRSCPRRRGGSTGTTRHRRCARSERRRQQSTGERRWDDRRARIPSRSRAIRTRRRASRSPATTAAQRRAESTRRTIKVTYRLTTDPSLQDAISSVGGGDVLDSPEADRANGLRARSTTSTHGSSSTDAS